VTTEDTWSLNLNGKREYCKENMGMKDGEINFQKKKLLYKPKEEEKREDAE
jgi:hypothetical protein